MRRSTWKACGGSPTWARNRRTSSKRLNPATAARSASETGWSQRSRTCASARRTAACSHAVPGLRRAGPQVRAQRVHCAQHGFVARQARGLLGQRPVRVEHRAAERPVLEHDPPGRARGGDVSLVPHRQQLGLEVEHLVRPALGHRGHAGVHGLGLEHEALAVVGPLLAGVDLERRRAALHHRDRPRRVAVRPVGVALEVRVQRLDAGQAGGPVPLHRLSHTDNASCADPT